MLRYLGFGGLGLLLLVLMGGACSATGVNAAPYQTGWNYPYLPWYWGGLYYHYPWTNNHYIEYHGGYTRNGTLAPGYSYDPVKNVVVTRSGQPAYPNPRATNEITPRGGAPDPKTLNPPPSTKSAAGGCSGENSCTGGGNAVTNKSGGNAPAGNGATGCSGQGDCSGGGNAVTNKSGGPSNSTGSNAPKSGSNGADGSTGAKGSSSSSGSSKPSAPPKASGPSKPSGPSSSGGGSRPSGGGSRPSGGGSHSGGGRR